MRASASTPATVSSVNADERIVIGTSSGGCVVLTAAEKKARLSLIPETLVELCSTIEAANHADLVELRSKEKAQLYRHLDVERSHGTPAFYRGHGLSRLHLELRRDLELW